MANYGEWVGPGAKFRTVVDYTAELYDSSAIVYHRVYVEVYGEFNGTTVHNNYGYGDFSLGNSSGVYGDSGWVSVGEKSYGSTVTDCPEVWYTSGSGTKYKSAAAGSYTVPYNSNINPPSNLSYTRITDNRVNLTWTASSSYKTAVLVERQTDGGQWSQIAELSASATSYADTTTSADHTYSYRVRVTNGVFYSSYATSATVITMAPAAPTAITLARATDADVAVTLVNNTNTATSLAWEKQEQGSTIWVPSSENVPGKVTSFTATGMQGTYRIRVQNVNALGSSAWLESEYITTICAPNPPTLLEPIGVFNMASGTITFRWLHNAIDGSAQTAAELHYKLHGAQQWSETVSIGTDNEYSLSASTFQAGSLVDWEVRTKGAHAYYSNWSSTGQFHIYQVPSLSLISPSDVVKVMPIACQVTYSDPQNPPMPCASATVSMYDGDSIMFSEPMDINGNTLTASLTADEFVPENGKTYTVVVTARSSSTLQAIVSKQFTVSYTPPKKAYVNVTNDADTGYANLLVAAVQDDERKGDPAVFDNVGIGYSVHDVTIRGRSVRWNKVMYGKPNMIYAGSEHSTVTVSPNDKLITAHDSQLTSIRSWFNINYSLESGHKYGLFFDYKASSTCTLLYGVISEGYQLKRIRYATTEWNSGSSIISDVQGYSPIEGMNLGFCSNDLEESGYLYIKNLIIFDMTEIFGEGNEPETISAFLATRIGMYINGSVYERESEIITTCGIGSGTGSNLSWGNVPIIESGTDESATPNFLNNVFDRTYLASVGEAYDLAQLSTTASTITRRIGCVDLGSLEWEYEQGETPRFHTTGIQSLVKCPSESGMVSNLLCAIYTAAGSYTDDMTMYVDTSGILSIHNSGYQTAAAFKTAMSGKLLYYELAQSQIINLAERLADGVSIEADGGGTVAFESESGFPVPNEMFFKVHDSTWSAVSGTSPAQSVSVPSNGRAVEICKLGGHTEVSGGQLINAVVTNIKSKDSDNATIANFEITQEIRNACPCYGASAGSAYNYIDFERRVYIQNVASVDLGSLNFERVSYSGVYFFQVALSGTKQDNYSVHSICAKYEAVASAVFANFTDKKTRIYNTKLQIRDDSYTDAAAFKAAMDGVMLYYELATPVEVDLSTMLPSKSALPQPTASVSLESALPTPITATAGYDGQEYTSIQVYRVSDHRKLLMDGAVAGQSLIDKYAPLNTEYTYEVITRATSGAIAVNSIANVLKTNRWFAYWGDNIAYAIWNPEEGGIELSRPEKVHVRYSGRRDPVSYDGLAFGESRSMGFTIIDKERVPAFRKLMDDGGRGIFKSCDGDVYHADFGVSITPEYMERGYYGGVEVSITRIAGDSL